ncbi:MAG: hypothetical protein AAF419_03375 [Pseudomonadota bacterium]
MAKSFARGTIPKESYRKSRAELIRNIIAGKVNVKAIDYEPPLKPANDIEEAITEGITRDATQITAPNQRPKPDAVAPKVKQNVPPVEPSKKSPFVFIAASTAIVLALIIAVVLFYPKPPELSQSDNSEPSATSSKTTNNQATNTRSTSNSSAGAESLIGSFLNEKDWSENNLNMFIDSWSELTQEEKDAAVSTKRMQRLKNSIYKQFLEGKALASIDKEKALTKQQKLIEFASAIGISDARLKLE